MSKSRDIADSAATINFIDDLTSSAQSQIDAKAPIASPTFTGTVTATSFSGDGSGLTNVEALPSQTGNAGNYLTTDGTNPSWVSIATPSFEAIASGSLSDGSTVALNADGTVSVVSGATASQGTHSVFEAGSTSWAASCYHSGLGKIVIAYRDTANSNAGTAIVGTVSGTSISFGTPTVFDTGNSQSPAIAYDTNTDKVAIIYADGNNSFYITAIVGTVSGTSISFGSPTVIESVSSFGNAIVFDPVALKMVAIYGNSSSSAKATVGTITGTSISFGASFAFSTYLPQYPSVCYYSSLNKIVIAYADGQSAIGKAVVGTVSGTSISFGAEYTFNSGYTAYTSITYDSNVDRFLIAYEDVGNAQYGTAIVGKVSGSVISYGSEFVFYQNTSSYLNAIYDPLAKTICIAWRNVSNQMSSLTAKITDLSITYGAESTLRNVAITEINSSYDTANNRIVYSYVNGTSSNRGEAFTYSPSYTNSASFVGISDGAYSDGDTARVQTIGSIDDAQSGLVIGSPYYVNISGGLDPTPDSPEVFAGTAVAATKIIVKG